MKSRFDTSKLKPGIWFVRSGKGNGVMPVTPEGRRLTALFLLGMLGSGFLGCALTLVFSQTHWLAVIPMGMILSAFWFIRSAMKHAARSIKYTDILVKE